MEVDQKDSLGSVSDNTLQNDTCPSPCSSRPQGRDGLNLTATDKALLSSHNEKIAALKKCLQSDIKATDIKWSIFVASSQSYRFDSCLKPFPPMYMDGLERDIDQLRETIGKVPCLSVLLHDLNDCEKTCQIDKKVIELMHWLLIEQEPKLTAVVKEEFERVLQLAPSNMSVHKPNYIFKVASNWGDSNQSRWEQMTKTYGTRYAYHGSRLENFHSILRYGLQQHLNKNGLFGAGIYLSSELGVSLPYSSTGGTWSNSLLGGQMSCVALCETIDHPDVKCKQQGGSEVEARVRALSKDSINGEVPEKYLLVRNSDLVRLRYLLVYSKPHTHRNNREQRVAQHSRLVGWLRQHKTAVLISAYVMLLVAIGVGSSPNIQRTVQLTLRKLGLQ